MTEMTVYNKPSPLNLAAMRTTLCLIENGDAIVGSTATTRAIKAQLRARIALLEANPEVQRAEEVAR
jgi:hypothetical protein